MKWGTNLEIAKKILYDKGEFMKTSLKEKINKFLELPEEIVYDVPKITVVGKILIVENYKNLMEYTKDKIRIITNIGILKVDGSDFEIKSMNKEEILVNGTIRKIELL